jgi:hypothetical protein
MKAACHWGSDSSVFNDALGEPGRTALYKVLPSAWSSVDGDGIFPHPVSKESSLITVYCEEI